MVRLAKLLRMRFFSVKEYVWAMGAPWCVFGRDCRLKA